MTDLLTPLPPADLPVIDENKDYYSDLVGEGKKYKDNAALAKAVMHGTQTIDIFKRRLDDLTEDYKKAREENVTKAKLEELIDKLSTKPASSEFTPANENNNQPPIDLTKIESLFEAKYASAKQAEREQANLTFVQNKLTERLGSNYQAAVKQQIDTLGLSSEDFHIMAKKSPAALLSALKIDQPQQTESFQAPFQTSQRKDNFAPTSGQKRTWTYYQELKKKDPQAYYYDRNTAIQMQKDAVELGEAFRDGDYYRKGLHE